MRSRRLAGGLAAACAGCAIAAVILVLVQGWSFADALDGFVTSNVVIGSSFGLCGALIAWHRPRLPVGWLLAVGGLLQLCTAVAAPLAETLRDAGAPLWLVRLDLTVFNWAWPLNIGVALPLSLLLLPDGRLPSPRWRPVFWAVAATAPLFVLEIGLGPVDAPGLPDAFGTLRRYDDLSWLWTVSEIRWVLSMLIGLAALTWRYRRGTEIVRRQLLWPLAAAVVVLIAVTPFALVAGTPLLVLFALPLLPIGLTVGMLRHQLLDIRLVVARGVSYALLSALVLAAYVALVAVLSGVVSALVVALLALPVRARLQKAVERLMYGERADPLRVASRVGERLGTGLGGALEEVRAALRLPYVAVVVDDVPTASSGQLDGPSVTVALEDSVLVVGLRAGEKRLDAADARVLGLLAGPLSAAVHATQLSEQLQVSRERLVVAREEERRRLRRDLHDGLGPLLTGVALSADAAVNLVARSPQEAAGLMDEVRAQSRTAIAEVRRIVEDLRPPALDELGLIAALQVRAAQTSRRSDGGDLVASVEAPTALPALPAAIEVAAYRIVTEALVNTVRHSRASQVVVRLACGDSLDLEIQDDGASEPSWAAGVGITGMRERVAELGGSCVVGPGPHGGRVAVSLPLVGA